jgi:plasmid stabilization system protein ParE
MRVRITDPAKADLSKIKLYLQGESPAAARKVGPQLRTAFSSLAAFPQRGRPGLVAGTRENVSVSPYVIVYRITPDAIEVLRVWHQAQDRQG